MRTAKFMMELASLLIIVNLSSEIPHEFGVACMWVRVGDIGLSSGIIVCSLLELEALSECCLSSGGWVAVPCSTDRSAEQL